MSALLLAAASQRWLWYATRGAGTVTLLLLTASVVLGVVTARQGPRTPLVGRGPAGRYDARRSGGASGWARRDTGGRPPLPRFVTVAVHRNVSLLALAFLVLHIATTVIDGYVSIRWVDAVLPFTSSYHPLELGAGAVAVDLLLAVTVTSLLRSHLAFGAWRTVHWLSYASWAVAVLHGFLLGTDAGSAWLGGLQAGCVAVVLAAVVWRLGALVEQPADGAGAAPGGSTAAPVRAGAAPGPTRPPAVGEGLAAPAEAAGRLR